MPAALIPPHLVPSRIALSQAVLAPPPPTFVKLVPLSKALSPSKSHQEQTSALTWILFQSGYNQIFIIPAGATSIHIEEAAASRNFLGERWFGAGQPGAQRGNALPHTP